MISAGKKKKSSQNQNSTDTYTPAFSIDFTQDVLVFALCMWHCQILAYCIIFCILQICSSVGKKQQWKRQKKQSFNIFTVMQLYVASFFFSTYPICIYFSCTFSLGPQPILGERSSVSHWNDSSSLEGAPVSSLSHSERLAPLAEFRWAVLARFL